MTAAATYRVQGRVVLRRIGEDRLLVPVSGGVARENCVFPINETGEFIWDCLRKGRTLDETAAAIGASFLPIIEKTTPTLIAIVEAVGDFASANPALVSR